MSFKFIFYTLFMNSALVTTLSKCTKYVPISYVKSYPLSIFINSGIN